MTAQTLPAPQTPDSPRAAAGRTLLTGVAAVGLTFGLVVFASWRGWHDVTISGTALLLGWVYLGFGLGEFVFARRFRVVTLLLAVMLGFCGMFFSLVAVRWLGFDFK